jgi:PAS domain S-box-containing protein
VEVEQLHRCLNDLMGIMALPALWTVGGPQDIAGTLMDALLGMLRPAFVFVRLNDPDQSRSTGLARIAVLLEGIDGPDAIGRLLYESLGDLPRKWPARAQLSIKGAEYILASARLGIDGEIGIVVVGSQRADFPQQTERLVLEVAANQAAVGLQQERKLAEQQQLARLLDRRVAQRTTELAASNARLIESERESRLIVDSIPGLVALLSSTGDLEMVNRQLLDYFGQTFEELKLWGTNDTIHPEDLPYVTRVFSRAIASGTPYEIVQRFKRSDGVYHWFQNRGFPIRDTNGEVARWSVLLTDIDDRKRAEEALCRNEAFLAKAQRLSGTGSFSWCIETDEITFSEEACRIFAFDPAAPVNIEMISNRVHPDDLPLLGEKRNAARDVDESHDYEIRLQMPDGSMKYLHTISNLARDARGRREYIGAIQDVTQRRLAQEALNKARSELAHVSRVTSLSAMTASLAHEINQPLSGIIINASTCLRMLDADPQNIEGARETARRTLRDGNRASDVITRLRGLFANSEFRLEPIDLNEAAREIVALTSSDLQRNRVVVQFELTEDLPAVKGDRIQLQQVILNLVRNASEAMAGVQDRPRNLVIRTAADTNGHVCLSIQDTGVGFGSQNLDKLFDSFYTTKSGGMGIGLSVSRSIIDRHHGRLWAVPNDGPGATFALSIPCETSLAANS